METPPGPERISRRLREQFAPAYLAITGLVQVLVLDALISKVEDDYAGYGVADWLVVAATFLVCVDIWHEYLMTVLSHVWLPGQFADEERDLPLALATRHWYRAVLAVAVTAFGLLGWLLYDPLGLDAVPVAVAAAGLTGVVAIIASSVPMWNEILTYARGNG
jgi:hypothetical protein